MIKHPEFKPSEVKIDRATVHLSGVFQSSEYGGTVHLSHAFDRILEPRESPDKQQRRLFPGKPVTLDPENSGRPWRWVIVHEQTVTSDPMLLAGVKANTLRVEDVSGNLVTLVPYNEASTFVHPGPLVLTVDRATANLQLLAMPY